MTEIETLLREQGATILYARGPAGARVTPAQAYGGWELPPEVAPRVTYHDHDVTPGEVRRRGGDTEVWQTLPQGGSVCTTYPSGVVLVECGPRGGYPGAVVIDHHRPGDPGYSRPRAEAVAASSLGQLAALLARGHGPALHVLRGWAWGGVAPSDAPLGSILWVDHDPEDSDSPACSGWGVVWEGEYDAPEGDSPLHQIAMIPPIVAVIAALDHCLPAALRGECAGVSAGDALAEVLSRTGAPTGVQLDEARAALTAAPLLSHPCRECGGEGCDARGYPCPGTPPVRDLRGVVLPARGAGDRGAYPGLALAASLAGEGYVTLVATRAGEGYPAKLVMGGEVPPEVVQELLSCPEEWVPPGYEQAGAPYGVPARGIGGLPLRPVVQ